MGNTNLEIKTKMRKPRHVSVRMEESLIKLLERKAKACHTTLSEMIRHKILHEMELESHKRGRKITKIFAFK